MTKYINDMKNRSGIDLFPPIRRMRDFHLYDYRGNRYLDLYLLNGLALMGHKPGKIPLVLKTMAAKGLLASYPSIYEERLKKALQRLLPECTRFRIYRNWERLNMCLAELFKKETVSPSDPLFPSESEVQVTYWRPFLPLTGGFSAIVPLLPASCDFFPAVVGFPGGEGKSTPSSDIVSPVLLAMATRSIYDLLSYSNRYNEELWQSFPLPYWRRQGPYLLFSGKEETYPQVFKNCKAHGILISPEVGKPSVIPGEWIEGEIQFLRKG